MLLAIKNLPNPLSNFDKNASAQEPENPLSETENNDNGSNSQQKNVAANGGMDASSSKNVVAWSVVDKGRKDDDDYIAAITESSSSEGIHPIATTHEMSFVAMVNTDVKYKVATMTKKEDQVEKKATDKVLVFEEKATETMIDGIKSVVMSDTTKQKDIATPAPRSETPTKPTKEQKSIEKLKYGGGALKIFTTEEKGTPSLTLAQRMKAMFDSSSPDQPSNAFGKNTSPRTEVTTDAPKQQMSSLAKDMKNMFDSSSSEEPSRAFCVGNRSSPKGRDSTKTLMVETVECDDNHTAQKKETKPTSPVSVAEQMVSMMWTSSLPSQNSPASSTDPDLQESVQKSDNSTIESHVTLIEIEDEDEVIEEIIVDENVNENTAEYDDEFEEIIEEVTVKNDDPEDYFRVESDNELFKIKDGIEVLVPDYANVVAKDNNDERSYDEITVDDSEFEEKTLDGVEEENILQKHVDVDDECNGRVDEKEDKVNCKTAFEPKATAQKMISDVARSYRSSDNPKKNYDNGPKRMVNLKQVAKKISSTTSIIPQCSSASEALRNLALARSQVSHHLVSPKVEKLNPRLAMDHSPTGKLAEKLKMFDSPESLYGWRQTNTAEQSWRRPLTVTGSSREDPNREMESKEMCNRNEWIALPDLEPSLNQADHLAAKTVQESEQDKVLIDKIVSLMQEPGARQNKHVLAESILRLVTGKIKANCVKSIQNQPFSAASSKPIKEVKGIMSNQLSHSHSSRSCGNYPSSSGKKAAIEMKESILNQPLYSSPLIPLKRSPSQGTVTSGVNIHSNRKNGDYKDPGLKQKRKDMDLRKGHVNNVKGDMPRISIEDRKEEVAKHVPKKLSLLNTQKEIDPEAIMARIWPNTPDGEKKPTRTLSSSSSGSSKSIAFEIPKLTPRKLRNRSKMFESNPFKTSINYEKDSFIELPNSITKKMKESSITLTNENVCGNTRCEKKCNETVKKLTSFQKIWRARMSKRGTKTEEKGVDYSITKIDSSTLLKGRINFNPCTNNNFISDVSKPVRSSLLVPNSPKASKKPSATHNMSNRKNGSDSGVSFYSLEDLERGNFDQTVVNMDQWEGFLSDDSFVHHFGLTKHVFYQQPKWKRDKQKRKVRVGF